MKYLLTLFLLVGCSKTLEPKFHYGDWVEINDPFFGKCVGQVMEYTIYSDRIVYDLNSTNIKCNKGVIYSRLHPKETQLIFIKSGEVQ